MTGQIYLCNEFQLLNNIDFFKYFHDLANFYFSYVQYLIDNVKTIGTILDQNKIDFFFSECI